MAEKTPARGSWRPLADTPAHPGSPLISKPQRATGSLAARLLRPQALRDPHEEHRTSTWLELFFDLCFVVAVASLARGLHSDPTPQGILSFLALFVPVWWAWMAFTWYAAAFDNDDVLYRVAMLAAMLCIVWLASSIEAVVVGGATISFVLAYIGLKLLIVGLYIRSARDAQGIVHHYCAVFATGNTLGAVLWLASVVVPEPVRYVVWALAISIEMLTPILAWNKLPDPNMTFHPEHIPERYGLFTLIVLGESVLAVASGAAGADRTLAATLTGVFGFLAAACIWWLYFDYAASSAVTLGVRASFSWGYAHLVIYASIAAFGVGIQFAIEGAADGSHGGEFGAGARTILGGAAAVYLASITFIHWVNRRSLENRVVAARLGFAAALIGLVIFGSPLSPPAFAGLLALALLALTAIETVRAGRLTAGELTDETISSPRTGESP